LITCDGDKSDAVDAGKLAAEAAYFRSRGRMSSGVIPIARA